MKSKGIAVRLLLLALGCGVCFAANIPTITAPKKKMRLLKVRQDNQLWYFNGAQPANYTRAATLSVLGAGSNATYLWQIVAGANKVAFAGGANLTAPTVNVVSTGESAPASGVTPDVSIRVTVNGNLIVNYSTAVFAPHEFRHLNNVDRTNSSYNGSNFGYLSEIHYQILDQFGRQLPWLIELNEWFTTGQTSDYNVGGTTTTWRQSTPGGNPEDPADWYDIVGGENLAFTPLVPVPVGPTDPNANNPVAHWDGQWKVGSTTVGATGNGRLVQTNRWQKYLGLARHTNVVSPP